MLQLGLGPDRNRREKRHPDYKNKTGQKLFLIASGWGILSSFAPNLVKQFRVAPITFSPR